MKSDPFLANATNALRQLRSHWEKSLAVHGDAHGQEEPFPQDHNFVMRVGVKWMSKGKTFLLLAELDIPRQSIHFRAEGGDRERALVKPTHPRECDAPLAEAVLGAFTRWVAEGLPE